MQEIQETWVWSLGQEDPLEEDKATQSSIVVLRIPWTEAPGRLQSIGSQRIRHDWHDLAHIHATVHKDKVGLAEKWGHNEKIFKSSHVPSRVKLVEFHRTQGSEGEAEWDAARCEVRYSTWSIPRAIPCAECQKYFFFNIKTLTGPSENVSNPQWPDI